MTAPIITVQSCTTTRISHVAGKDASVVAFTADQDLTDWQARADGAGVGQGDLVGQASGTKDTWDKFDANGLTWADLDAQGHNWNNLAVVLLAAAAAQFTVDDEELTWGDKAYRINVYGKNNAGEWSAYG